MLLGRGQEMGEYSLSVWMDVEKADVFHALNF
jgi:hypothetical protein